MPKQKTHRASAKRFSFTATGKVKRGSSHRQHILTKKSTKRKRQLRKSAYASTANASIVRKLLPYK